MLLLRVPFALVPAISMLLPTKGQVLGWGQGSDCQAPWGPFVGLPLSICLGSQG